MIKKDKNKTKQCCQRCFSRYTCKKWIKRIRNKNLIKIKRKYLIEYTFSLIKNLKLEKQSYVTTDSNKIISLSKKYKIRFIKRPKNKHQNHRKCAYTFGKKRKVN